MARIRGFIDETDPNQFGQIELYTYVYDRDTGNALGNPAHSHERFRSTCCATVGTTLTIALPKNVNGYQISILVQWSVLNPSLYPAGNRYGDAWTTSLVDSSVYPRIPLTVNFDMDVTE